MPRPSPRLPAGLARRRPAFHVLPRVCRDPERPLRIRAGYAAQAVQPRHQESLFNTIGNVLPKLPLEEKLAAIKRAISNKTIQTTSLNVLRGVTEDHDPEEWQEAFDGGIHCEAQLMQDYGSNVRLSYYAKLCPSYLTRS